MYVWGVRVRDDASGPGEVVFELEGTRLKSAGLLLSASSTRIPPHIRQGQGVVDLRWTHSC